ncbi:MAG: hypothetical protein Kow0069_19680 [Promethearchaeota archaeon]
MAASLRSEFARALAWVGERCGARARGGPPLVWLPSVESFASAVADAGAGAGWEAPLGAGDGAFERARASPRFGVVVTLAALPAKAAAARGSDVATRYRWLRVLALDPVLFDPSRRSRRWGPLARGVLWREAFLAHLPLAAAQSPFNAALAASFALQVPSTRSWGARQKNRFRATTAALLRPLDAWWVGGVRVRYSPSLANLPRLPLGELAAYASLMDELCRDGSVPSEAEVGGAYLAFFTGVAAPGYLPREAAAVGWLHARFAADPLAEVDAESVTESAGHLSLDGGRGSGGVPGDPRGGLPRPGRRARRALVDLDALSHKMVARAFRVNLPAIGLHKYAVRVTVSPLVDAAKYERHVLPFPHYQARAGGPPGTRDYLVVLPPALADQFAAHLVDLSSTGALREVRFARVLSERRHVNLDFFRNDRRDGDGPLRAHQASGPAWAKVEYADEFEGGRPVHEFGSNPADLVAFDFCRWGYDVGFGLASPRDGLAKLAGRLQSLLESWRRVAALLGDRGRQGRLVALVEEAGWREMLERDPGKLYLAVRSATWLAAAAPPPGPRTGPARFAGGTPGTGAGSKPGSRKVVEGTVTRRQLAAAVPGLSPAEAAARLDDLLDLLEVLEACRAFRWDPAIALRRPGSGGGLASVVADHARKLLAETPATEELEGYLRRLVDDGAIAAPNPAWLLHDPRWSHCVLDLDGPPRAVDALVDGFSRAWAFRFPVVGVVRARDRFTGNLLVRVTVHQPATTKLACWTFEGALTVLRAGGAAGRRSGGTETAWRVRWWFSPTLEWPYSNQPPVAEWFDVREGRWAESHPGLNALRDELARSRRAGGARAAPERFARSPSGPGPGRAPPPPGGGPRPRAGGAARLPGRPHWRGADPYLPHVTTAEAWTPSVVPRLEPRQWRFLRDAFLDPAGTLGLPRSRSRGSATGPAWARGLGLSVAWETNLARLGLEEWYLGLDLHGAGRARLLRGLLSPGLLAFATSPREEPGGRPFLTWWAKVPGQQRDPYLSAAVGRRARVLAGFVEGRVRRVRRFFNVGWYASGGSDPAGGGEGDPGGRGCGEARGGSAENPANLALLKWVVAADRVRWRSPLGGAAGPVLEESRDPPAGGPAGDVDAELLRELAAVVPRRFPLPGDCRAAGRPEPACPPEQWRRLERLARGGWVVPRLRYDPAALGLGASLAFVAPDVPAAAIDHAVAATCALPAGQLWELEAPARHRRTSRRVGLGSGPRLGRAGFVALAHLPPGFLAGRAAAAWSSLLQHLGSRHHAWFAHAVPVEPFVLVSACFPGRLPGHHKVPRPFEAFRFDPATRTFTSPRKALSGGATRRYPELLRDVQSPQKKEGRGEALKPPSPT